LRITWRGRTAVLWWERGPALRHDPARPIIPAGRVLSLGKGRLAPEHHIEQNLHLNSVFFIVFVVNFDRIGVCNLHK